MNRLIGGGAGIITRLCIISGPGRSGTTYLHDRLIQAGLFKGIVASASEHKSAYLTTDEYRPAMEAVAKYELASRAFHRRYCAWRLTRMIRRLAVLFADTSGEILLKGPQYALGLRGLRAVAAQDLRFVYLDRYILGFAASAARHPYFSEKLGRPLNRCGDFERGRGPFFHTIDQCHAAPEVLTFAKTHWDELDVRERSFLPWHYYRRALAHGAHGLSPDQLFILPYEDLAEDYAIVALSQLFGRPENALRKALADFSPTPVQLTRDDLSPAGRKFHDLCLEASAYPLFERGGR